MKVPLDRKQTAPRNLAAKALRDPKFTPKIERDPKAYRRRQKHRVDPAINADEAMDEA